MFDASFHRYSFQYYYGVDTVAARIVEGILIAPAPVRNLFLLHCGADVPAFYDNDRYPTLRLVGTGSDAYTAAEAALRLELFELAKAVPSKHFAVFAANPEVRFLYRVNSNKAITVGCAGASVTYAAQVRASPLASQFVIEETDTGNVVLMANDAACTVWHDSAAVRKVRALLDAAVPSHVHSLVDLTTIFRVTLPTKRYVFMATADAADTALAAAVEGCALASVKYAVMPSGGDTALLVRVGTTGGFLLYSQEDARARLRALLAVLNGANYESDSLQSNTLNDNSDFGCELVAGAPPPTAVYPTFLSRAVHYAREQVMAGALTNSSGLRYLVSVCPVDPAGAAFLDCLKSVPLLWRARLGVCLVDTDTQECKDVGPTEAVRALPKFFRDQLMQLLLWE